MLNLPSIYGCLLKLHFYSSSRTQHDIEEQLFTLLGIVDAIYPIKYLKALIFAVQTNSALL